MVESERISLGGTGFLCLFMVRGAADQPHEHTTTVAGLWPLGDTATQNVLVAANVDTLWPLSTSKVARGTGEDPAAKLKFEFTATVEEVEDIVVAAGKLATWRIKLEETKTLDGQSRTFTTYVWWSSELDMIARLSPSRIASDPESYELGDFVLRR